VIKRDLFWDRYDVLFFGGSDGTVGTTLTTLQPDGKNAGEFGPEVTFGRTIADASPATQYTLIKYAAGGTALYNDWAPGTGNEYAAFRNTVTAGLAALQAAGFHDVQRAAVDPRHRLLVARR
jgi:pectin methylesterase-like acyl-CoA thioesterase